MEFIEYHRWIKGHDQKTAANAIGVTKAAWNKWENLGKVPNEKNLAKLARYCKVTTQQMLAHFNPDAAKFAQQPGAQ